MTKQGLDAAGFLVLAGGHLRKAREGLAHSPASCSYLNTKHALETVRLALRQLKYEKEGWPREEESPANGLPRDDHWYHENPNY